MNKFWNNMNKFLKNISKDQWLMVILSIFLFILVIRIFYLEVVMGSYYQQQIINKNLGSTNIAATRGNIYMSDKSGNPIKLTENIDSYNLFVEPQYIMPNKDKFIPLISPVLYRHFCAQNGNKKIDKDLDCIKNIEKFINQNILPPDPQLFFKLDGGLVTGYMRSGQLIPLTQEQINSTGYRGVRLVTGYIYSGMTQQYIDDTAKAKEDYQIQLDQIMSGWNSGQAISLISNKLDQTIFTGVRQKNFFRYIDNDLLINDLKNSQIEGMEIIGNHYVYFYPEKINNKTNTTKKIQDIFLQYGEDITENTLKSYIYPQQNRYILITKGVNPIIYYEIDQLKNKYSARGLMEYINTLNKNGFSGDLDGGFLSIDMDKINDKTTALSDIRDIFGLYGYDISDRAANRIIAYNPNKSKSSFLGISFGKSESQHILKIYPSGLGIFHGLGAEKGSNRYYPNGELLSNVLGYVDADEIAYGGLEKFFDESLAGQDGKIIGLGAGRLGQVGSNDFDIKDKIDGNNVYVTIDPVIQKETEKLIKFYQKDFRADSIAITIMNPYNAKVIAMANYPNYDPNDLSNIYNLRPLEISDRYLIDDESYKDVPIYYQSGGKLMTANSEMRKNLTIPKYIYKNINGPSVLIDKNISLPYEPGSVFKGFTVGIGLDTDEISLTDTYYDKGNLTIDDFKISNVAAACLGTNTFLHGLQFSCNVGMIRIIQKIGERTYYNYLEKLSFGKQTGIELANEDKGLVADPNNNSKAQFYTNSFGMGILVTPMQLAAGYSALVNGGYYIKPTIVDKITNSNGQVIYKYEKPQRLKIFKQETSEQIKYALFQVVNGGQIKRFALPGFTLGGKTGTAQIVCYDKVQKKNVYCQGPGWTNGSFAGILTKDDLKYVIIIQIRRPRSNLRGEFTAGKIFGDLAKFIISYDGIEK